MIKLVTFIVKFFATLIAFIGFFIFLIISFILWDDRYVCEAGIILEHIWDND